MIRAVRQCVWRPACAALALLVLSLARPLAAQERTVAVTVRGEPEGRLLPNAELIVLRGGAHRFTGSDGVARLRLPGEGVTVRVRQIGYVFRDVEVPAGATELEVALQRLPFALPTVRANANSACDGITPADGALEAWALAQLREGAERYEAYRKEYPFDVTQRRRTVESPGTPRALAREHKETIGSANWGERYVRGDVVRETAFGFSVPILFLATLGDSAFWDHHCAEHAVVEGDSVGRKVRLRFVPATTVRTTDWIGDAWLDSTTSALIRVDFRLRVSGKSGPRRFEGYTTFRQAAPFIQVPDSTVAIWWRQPPADTAQWGLPSVVQGVMVEGLKFKRARP